MPVPPSESESIHANSGNTNFACRKKREILAISSVPLYYQITRNESKLQIIKLSLSCRSELIDLMDRNLNIPCSARRNMHSVSVPRVHFHFFSSFLFPAFYSKNLATLLFFSFYRNCSFVSATALTGELFPPRSTGNRDNVPGGEK